ncbi:IS3 family transposase [Escherichia coli]|jgi:putative transposase|uniref:IS3 family transposase n=11 Tax=Brevibacillus TaxID=55080 RepID=A0A7T5JNH2_9BACL|nr:MULTISPECIES: IS3 family transposase [Bacillota]ELK38835.1 integrase, catalytic region [Brevibacillus agri BAB-2500]MBP2799628.1 IS3 family transposase [Escherichia coli]MBG9566271.1 integrase [Brevibacillus agri]MDN4095481.1 IS3 family transposase [Brevibacillus agri]MDT7989160.1 IS3 family transposase [Clostridium perfringens]
MEIADKWIQLGYTAKLVLRIVGILEATYYYRKNKASQKPRVYHGGRPIPGYSLSKDGQPVSDEQIKEWLSELIADEESAYGYRKLTVCLRRDHQLVINKKKVYRLLKEEELLQPQRQKKRKHPRKLANNREITAPNQLWEMDVKYGFIVGEQRFFFLMSLIDVYDRAIVDYHFGLTCEGKHAAQILQRALWKRQQFNCDDRPVIRTDNGPQFISHAFEEACQHFQTVHERIPPKTPNKNAHIESFHSVLEKECLQRNEFQSYQEAYEIVTNYLLFYNQRRIHGSLYDLSPVEFGKAFALQLITPFVVKV